jgi:hypothetical protein
MRIVIDKEMLALTHIVASLLLIQLMTLDRNDAFVALLFGVFIDLDHLFGLKNYAEAEGVRSLFDLDTMMDPGGRWKSIMHSPVAVMITGPLSIASKLAIPLIFWGVHISMDYVEQNLLGNFSSLEAALLVLSGFALLSIRFSLFVEGAGAKNFREYVRAELRSLRSMGGAYF